jgi:membrane protein insertase Oxa1/YidC/SpoIIIJ
MKVLYTVFIKPIELFLALVFENLVKAGAGYGPALLLLSLVVTIVTAPLYYLAEKWRSQEEVVQRRMAKDVASIRAHYNGQKRFYLLRNAHRLYGYGPISPLRASMGLIIQIPFFLAPYLYLSRYTGYAGTSFLFLQDLARPDGLLWGANLLPFVMTVVNVAASLLYARGRSARGTLQLLALAGFFLVVLYDRPSGLLLYWTMNNLLSIPKNAVMARMLPSPRGAAEEVGDSGAQESVWDLIRKYLEPAKGPLLVFLLFGIQVYWQLHFDRSFKYAIAATAAAGLILSCVLVLRRIRRGPPPSKAALIALAAQWALFGFAAYLLVFARIQNAYISNTNIKLLTVLIQDAIIGTSLMGLLARRAASEKEVEIPHRTRLFIFAFAFLLLYLFIISPALIYFSSPRDIGMGLGELLLRNSLAAVLLFVPGLAVFRLAGAGGQSRAVWVVVAVILVVLVFNYIIPGDYGTLDELHLEKDYLLESPRIPAILLDLVVIAASCAVAWVIVRKRAAIVVPCLLAFTAAFGVQTAVASFRTEWKAEYAAPSHQEASLPAESGDVHRFSTSKANILLVIADMFNGNYIGKLVRENPEYRDALDGFTWYPNTLSISSTTVTSMPAMLAGPAYFPQAMNRMPGKGREKYEGAVREFCEAMLAGGLDVSTVDLTYTDPTALCGRHGGRLRTSSSSAYVGYWKKRTGYDAGEEVDSGKNRLLVMVALFQSAPVMVKTAIYDAGSWLIFRKSYQIRKMARNAVKTYAYLDLLPELSSTADTAGTFKLIHTQFTHEPFGVNRQGSIIRDEFPDPESGTRSFVDGRGAYNAAKKMVDFLLDWTDWMKANGVYDNTFIVMASDHGNNAQDSGLSLPPGLDNPLNRWEISKAYPLLLIKRFGASGQLRVDERFLSNADTARIIHAAAGVHGALGSDPTVGTPETGRTLTYSRYYGKWDDFMKNDRATLSTYTVKDDLRVSGNWSKE